jgi:hypothetical protein
VSHDLPTNRAGSGCEGVDGVSTGGGFGVRQSTTDTC